MVISPKTKVGELLDTFPELEAVLIQMSPAFEKLKNPILRKTVARVATLQQIAVVGGISVDVILNRLRKEAGQDDLEVKSTDSEYLSVGIPPWFREDMIVIRFDATGIINSGGSPMNEILKHTNQLKSGEIFELTTPFIPAPILDMLKGKKFLIHCIERKNNIISYISQG
jgi:hypothetical protein